MDVTIYLYQMFANVPILLGISFFEFIVLIKLIY